MECDARWEDDDDDATTVSTRSVTEERMRSPTARLMRLAAEVEEDH